MTAIQKTSPVLSPPIQEFSFDAAVTGAAFLADGTLAVGLGDGSVRLIHEHDDDEPTKILSHEKDAAILVMAVDLGGTAVLTGGDDGRLVRTDANGEIKVLAKFPNHQIDVLAVSPAGGLRAVAIGREVQLLNEQGEIVAKTADHPSTVSGLAFNPKGKRLAASHYGGVTLWWTNAFGQTPARLEWQGSHIGVTWSPDGSMVLTTMQDNELHGWRLTDDAHMRMGGYVAKVRSLDWRTRPMALFTSGSDCTLGWGFTGGGPIGKPPMQIGSGLGQLVTSIAVHPKMPLIAAGYDDGQIVLCELPGERIVRLKADDDQRIDRLAWSPDHSRLAAGTNTGTAYLFDLSKKAA